MNKTVILLVLVTMFMSSAFALGIASDYVGPDGTTLYLEKGQTYDYGIRVQNVQGEDIKVTVKVTGAEIIDPKSEYVIPAHTTKNEIKLRVTMPNDANQKTIVPVTWEISEVSSNTGGQVSAAKQITGGIQAMLPRAAPSFWNLYWKQIIGALVLSGVIFGIVRKERKHEQQQVEHTAI